MADDKDDGLSDLLDVSKMSAQGAVWYQREITLKAQKRGCHVITQEIQNIPELAKIRVGLAHILIKHTSASLALNESWDPDVRVDSEMMLNRLVPENAPYIHTIEGKDDMPAHFKACLMGSSLTLPITNGKLNIGQWQGVWLCEHRNHGGSRHLVITVQGAPMS
ncbi:uncharacterized protein LOC106179709 [Lingula anatina]|uniref:Uncharacterized protein LOC106179709 n=1 Tax=Lingula anatina TaxID=7574 RepID=A0A1S3K8C9_LINAN|nr:uncharacterized protein LOC106179709 [Lingula anatina]|eukprot:XP_013418890.1 uncharacterized protein LOC106179709 [Lingula anatina]